MLLASVHNCNETEFSQWSDKNKDFLLKQFKNIHVLQAINLSWGNRFSITAESSSMPKKVSKVQGRNVLDCLIGILISLNRNIILLRSLWHNCKSLGPTTKKSCSKWTNYPQIPNLPHRKSFVHIEVLI